MPEEQEQAIFTAEQVESINGYQVCGMFHPFTCGNNHDGERVLFATTVGMKCHTCDYRQTWANSFMTDWTWKEALEASPMHKTLMMMREAAQAQ